MDSDEINCGPVFLTIFFCGDISTREHAAHMTLYIRKLIENIKEAFATERADIFAHLWNE